MKYTITTGDCADISTDCLVVGVYAGSKLTPSAVAVDQAAGGLLKRLVKRGDIEGASGHTLLVPCEDALRAPRLLVVGLGDANQLDADEFLAVVRSAAVAVRRTGATNATVTLAEAKVKQRDLGGRTRIIVEAFALSGYRFDQLKSKKSKSRNWALSKIILPLQRKHSVAAVRRSVREGEAISSGVKLARAAFTGGRPRGCKPAGC